jgi:hypothetical protein
VAYSGARTNFPGMPELNMPGSMRVAAQRECMALLADYEDTGLTPEQIVKLLQGNLRKN